MDNRKLIKKIEKNIGIKKKKNTIRSLNMALGFMAFLAGYSIYMNHTGWLLSYGIIVAAIAMLLVAGFLSYRIKLQVELNNAKEDYRQCIVKPAAEHYVEEGAFSRSGSVTEREIVSTLLFSDGPEYKYSSSNELKGVYKGVRFSNSDMVEDCYSNNIHVCGRLFSFDMPTRNVNPVIFTTATAGVIEFHHSRVRLIKTANDQINKMFRVYAFDENEANELLTDSMIHKLRELVALQLGKILKISFHSGKVYVFYTTDKPTYEEFFTKKSDVKEELVKTQNEFNAVGKIIDIL